MPAWPTLEDVCMTEAGYRVFRVLDVTTEGTVGATLCFSACCAARPGQFVMVWLPGIGERPFTVMDDAPFRLTIAAVGPFTRVLCSLSPGDAVWVRGPYGRGFEIVGRTHLLVGGGSGVASLALLAKRMCACRSGDAGHDVTVALGAKTANQLMLRWWFEGLGCRVLVATDDGSQGFHGTVLQAIRGCLAERPDSVYACGPEPMLRALVDWTTGLRLPTYVSMERVMRCGIGVCGNCHCGDRLVCRDGPVFPADEIRLAWEGQPTGTRSQSG